MRILGIDPGTGICGFGVIEVSSGVSPQMVDCGVITTPAHTPLEDRLLDIYQSLGEIISAASPDVVSVEKLFFTKNITTGISVAEARGVILLAARQHHLPIFEYTPNEIKKTLTGYGNAPKKQMQQMVKVRLRLAAPPRPDDAADALAAALTHHLMSSITALPA